MSDSLALLGGAPIARPEMWPTWPQPNGDELELVAETLVSGRWTVRSAWRGGSSQEQRLCEEFAAFAGARHAATAQTGTAALILALEGLGIGAGDEVVVPGLTWVATATAVLHVNARPVFADVEPNTLVLSPAAFAAAITPRTRCVIPVHWHGQIADMDAIVAIARRHDIRVLEDCAQAPGGRYKGRHVGTVGDVGAFSLHNDKLLTSGEGGLVITNDTALWHRMQVRRLDGFVWSDAPLRALDGWFQEDGHGPLLGMSNCMSEFQAAVARSQLRALPERTARRETNGELVSELIGALGAYRPLPRQPFVDVRPFNEVTIGCDLQAFGSCSIETLAWALQAELGFPVYPEGDAIPEHPAYRPETMRRYANQTAHLGELAARDSIAIPSSRRPATDHLMFLHPPLLADASAMRVIAAAFAKVQRRGADLRGVRCDPHGNLLTSETP